MRLQHHDVERPRAEALQAQMPEGNHHFVRCSSKNELKKLTTIEGSLDNGQWDSFVNMKMLIFIVIFLNCARATTTHPPQAECLTRDSVTLCIGTPMYLVEIDELVFTRARLSQPQ